MSLVTLVRPPSLIPTLSDAGPLTPPIGLAYLASSLQQAGHTVRIVDGVGEDPFQATPLFGHRIIAMGLKSEQIAERIEQETDLIGVSCMFSQDWPEVRRLIELIRRRLPHTTIVAGGEHVTAVPSFTLDTCRAVDFCVLGEGEETLVDLVAALDQGTSPATVAGIVYRAPDGAPRLTNARARIRGIDDIPSPAWDLVPIRTYLDHGLGYGVHLGRSMPIIATRGCPYQCTFCSNPQMWTTRWLARDPAKVLDEIQHYMETYRATNIDFYDLTAIVKKQWILEFCNLILERGMTFTWQLPSGTRSEALDDEVTRLLYRSGCRNLTYAPESGSAAVLTLIKKKVNLNKMQQSMRSAVRNGLNIKLNMILGLPDERRADVWRSIGFLARAAALGVHDASVSLFTPYPGSELYDRLVAEGRVPTLSEDFFLSLACYKDLVRGVSFTQDITGRELTIYRLLASLTFYGVQYTLRPWRLAGTILNLLRQRQVSRLDKSLQDLIVRVFRRRPPATKRVSL